MVSLKEFFNQQEDDVKKGISHKNNLIKRNIIAYMAMNGECTLAELTKELHISIPTITKLVGELVAQAIVSDNGKVETPGGRRPNVFGLTSSAIYFAGVDICREKINFAITDIKNNIVFSDSESNFELEDTPGCLEKTGTTIERFLQNCNVDRDKILGIGVCIAGRVNPSSGRSYKYFTFEERSLREVIEQRVGLRVLIENDTRARCFSEYFSGNVKDEKNVLYLHLGRGVAVGIVVDGKLYYGKSGFAGEFGHTPFFDNEIICGCGKKGCLETEVSGIALENKMVALIKQGRNTILADKHRRGERIHINDIVDAARKDDNLAIELIGDAGEKVGKSVAFLVNIFNPELVILGGNLSQAGDHIMLPIKSAASKYSLSLVANDTAFRLSQVGEGIGALGAAMLIRNKIIGL